MEIFFSSSNWILFFSAIPIGIAAILFGGTLFIALPLFQFLFPQASIGYLLGNIKFGSFFRSLSAIIATREQLKKFKHSLPMIFLLAIGTFLGAIGIIKLSQEFVFPIVLLGILITEFSDKITHYFSEKIFAISNFLVGIYGGIFGGGINILLFSLLKIKNPEIKDDISSLRVEATFLEFLLSIIVLLTVIFSWQIDFEIAGFYAAGGIIGGFLGGKLLAHTGKLKPSLQKLLLRISFAIALGVSALVYFR